MRPRGLPGWVVAGALCAGAALADGVPGALMPFFWPVQDERLHRFTAIHTTDGMNILLLSDRGVLATARLRRGQGGAITGIETQSIQFLRDTEGRPLTGPFRNAQGIAVGQDGRIFVSFEGHGRVWSYAAPDAPAQALPVHRDFARLTVGAGLSALAIGRSGVIHAIPQRPARMTHGIPSYHFWNGEWAGSFRLPADNGFHPVAADIGPDGRLYLLEQGQGESGRRVQIRRFLLAGSRIDGGAVVMRSAANGFDALSGLSIWRGSTGALRALMISHTITPERPNALIEVGLAQ